MWNSCSPCTCPCRSGSGCSLPRRENKGCMITGPYLSWLPPPPIPWLSSQWSWCLLWWLDVFKNQSLRFGMRFVWVPFWLFFLNKGGRIWTQISGKYFFFEFYIWHFIGGLLASSSSKQSTCNQKTGVWSCVRKISWRREWQPTPVFLFGEFHGQRSLVGLQFVGSQRVRCDWVTNTYTSSFLQCSKTNLKLWSFSESGLANVSEEKRLKTICGDHNNGSLYPCPSLQHHNGQKFGELKAGACSSTEHADTDHDNLSLMGTLLHKDCCGSEVAFEMPPPVLEWKEDPTDPQTQTATGLFMATVASKGTGRYRFIKFLFRE